ncbi:MAG: sigma 54-interacting transcriptional regulator [Candidatus Marinimicrobia bacterium]|nr:sigma 54-interacting transcriptional regulator [Candidatus Neomarinimicrobiota bacterium]
MHEQKDIFYQATLRICGSLDLSQALYDCLNYLSDIIPIDEINIHIFNQKAGYIRTIASADRNGPLPEDANNIVKMPQKAINQLKGKALADIRIVNDPKDDLVTSEMAKIRGKDNSSFIILRLIINNERLGTITFRSKGLNNYKKEDAELLESLRKPFGIALSNSLQYEKVNELRRRLEEDKEYLKEELKKDDKTRIIGAKFGLKNVMEKVNKVAPTDSPVLILGETGTGKEVIANAIHYSSKRSAFPLIKVNCGAIPESLIDSELFGHEKGAFTGAMEQKIGRFERADGGTIFLDEIGELPPEAQTRLLRVLAEQEIERVGGTELIKLDIRVIAATHKDLEEMVKEGKFRKDLWFRLSVFPVYIPPLRNRIEDIPALVDHFIRQRGRELGLQNFPQPSSKGLERLRNYDFPGNVRELKNIVEREMIINKSDTLDFNSIKQTGPSVNDENTYNPAQNNSIHSLDKIIKDHLERTLSRAKGKIEGKGGAAELLKLNPSTLRNKLRKYNIPFGRDVDWG